MSFKANLITIPFFNPVRKTLKKTIRIFVLRLESECTYTFQRRKRVDQKLNNTVQYVDSIPRCPECIVNAFSK